MGGVKMGGVKMGSEHRARVRAWCEDGWVVWVLGVRLDAPHQSSSSSAIVEKGTADDAPCAQSATSSKVKAAKMPPGRANDRTATSV
eukprot:scaffold22345_cov125-Isochrysis_galbana.AAC.2